MEEHSASKVCSPKTFFNGREFEKFDSVQGNVLKKTKNQKVMAKL